MSHKTIEANGKGGETFDIMFYDDESYITVNSGVISMHPNRISRDDMGDYSFMSCYKNDTIMTTFRVPNHVARRICVEASRRGVEVNGL